LCVLDSSCNNNANNKGNISGQSNQHLTTSIDQNSLCVQKNCANTGQRTTVLANHADCSSGPNGTTKVCLTGGKISYPRW